MGELLSYSINAAIVLLPLYLIYKWLLSHETFHVFNRAVILISYAAALLAVPVVALLKTSGSSDVSMSSKLPVINIENFTMSEPDSSSPVLTVLLIVYLLGGVIMAARLLWVWSRIFRIVLAGEKQPHGRYTLVLTAAQKVAPFSWMRYIVMSREDYEQAGDMIIAHETQHLRYRHWIDLLIAEAVIVLNWFNPAAWLMKEELRTVHEYQADMAVLRSGADAKSYQILLIKKAVGARFPSLANSLNHSKLKKRITMMLSNQSRKSRRLRALAIVPAVAAALLVVNQPSVAGTLSAISDSEISIADDKGSENSSNRRIRTTATVGKTVTIKSDTLVSEVNSFNIPKDSVTIILDGREITQEEFRALDPGTIRSINVDKRAPKSVITISTKESSGNAQKAVVIKMDKKNEEGKYETISDSEISYYIDGKKVSEADVRALNSSKVKEIEVKSGQSVYVTLK